MRYPLRVVSFLVLLVLLSANRLHGAVVREVRVKNLGGGALDRQSVLAYTSVKEGDEFDRAAVSRDVKALQESGRYAYVGAKAEPTVNGVVVIYEVKPMPKLRRLMITGAEYFDRGDIREWLELKEGDPVDDTTLAVKTLTVKEKYREKHFPFVEVDWLIDENPETGQAEVEIFIQEGERARVGRIRFKGNDSIKSSRLRDAMQLRSWNWLSFITKAGTFDPNILDTDLNAVRRVYLNEGFLDAKVGEPELRPLTRNRMEILIPIEEGQVYRISEVHIEGASVIERETLERVVTVTPGATASLAAIEKSGAAIEDFYGSRGYIRSQVRELLDPDPVRKEVAVTYRVTEGSLAYVRNVYIRGNATTKDKVIRRELAIFPGDIFDDVRIRRSERRLRNLNYFSSVRAIPEPTSEPDQFDLSFEVEEKRTGQFIVGAGFSSIDDLIAFIEISQGNFDLLGWPHFRGGGQKLKLRGQIGTSRTDVDVSFTEPWFLDRRLSLGLGFFRNEREFLSDEYDQRNTGGNISLGRALWGPNRASLQYRFENVEIFDVEEDASEAIQVEEGDRTKSAVVLDLTHDSRDNVFIPTRGNRTTLTSQLAGGPLGADTDIYKLELRTSQFIPLWFGHVFNLRGWTAVVEEYDSLERVPIFDRLFLGGPRTLRGFEFRDVGPKDENGDVIGGNTAAFGTVEYTIPVIERVRVATFFDIGQAWEESWDWDFSDVNSDWGIGLRMDLAQFPLRVDYAWPIEADEFNDDPSGRFNFLLGSFF